MATLDELKTAGMIVVRGARCPLLVVYDDGKVFVGISSNPAMSAALANV